MIRIDGSNNNQSLGCRSFIRFPASIIIKQKVKKGIKTLLPASAVNAIKKAIRGQFDSL